MSSGGLQHAVDSLKLICLLLTIPGALWGLHLFNRWLRGEGLDTKIDQINRDQAALRKELKRIAADRGKERTVITALARALEAQTRESNSSGPRRRKACRS